MTEVAATQRRRPPVLPGMKVAGRRLPGGLAVCALVGCLTVTMFTSPRPLLVWNETPSAPVGLYAISPPGAPVPGDMVIARVARPWRALAGVRGYIPQGVPLVKRVVAASGDTICAQGPVILRNARFLARRLARDARGRMLPWWTGCRTLRSGAVFLLNDNPASFDGRYLGVTPAGDLIGLARPLWTR